VLPDNEMCNKSNHQEQGREPKSLVNRREKATKWSNSNKSQGLKGEGYGTNKFYLGRVEEASGYWLRHIIIIFFYLPQQNKQRFLPSWSSWLKTRRVEPFFYHDVCSTHFHSSACSIYRSGLYWIQSETKVKGRRTIQSGRQTRSWSCLLGRWRFCRSTRDDCSAYFH
jgi:hypothetical protein